MNELIIVIYFAIGFILAFIIGGGLYTSDELMSGFIVFFWPAFIFLVFIGFLGSKIEEKLNSRAK